MSSALMNTIGLLLNVIGVGLLFRFGIPYRVETGGAVQIITREIDMDAIAAECRYKWLGWLGLVLIFIGTGFQIVAIWSG